MKDRVKELTENHTIDELAQMVVDLEAELSVKENMKIVEDCIKKDDDFEYRYLRMSVLAYQKEIPKLRKEVECLQKEVVEIRKRISDNLHEERRKLFEKSRDNGERPTKVIVDEFNLSDMFDELMKNREREQSEIPWFYDIFNPRLFK